MEMLLKCTAPSETNRLLLIAQTRIKIDAKSSRQELNDQFAVSDTFAIDFDPRVLTFWTFARIILTDLFIWDSRQFQPSEQLDSEWTGGGQTPVGAEGKDA